jgi:hypothetical protein
MADFPQQHEVHFPGNASPAADAPRDVAPPHPQSAPSYYPLPVPHGNAGVMPDGVVSIGVAIISHSQGAHMRCVILVPTSECCW